ncbi:MAG: PEP-CTERM sorting domain-containing protein [Acidobacteriota bacterium]|nr:PEP-CTERM sorting domain-containing protein [Acidobacteriota bacterium]MDQ3651748.1 PEP-CTERM sorting domain-containing protein [Acidobacteriota bacterium]
MSHSRKLALTILFVVATLMFPNDANGASLDLGGDPPPPPPLSFEFGDTILLNGTLFNDTDATLTNQNLFFGFISDSPFLTANDVLINSNFILQDGQQARGPLFTLTLGGSELAMSEITPGDFVFTIEVFYTGNGIRSNSLTFIARNGTLNSPIPEPATMLLLGTGIAGVALKTYRRRRG